jgi:hypothetical protein
MFQSERGTAMAHDDRLAYSIVETAHLVHMPPADVREAIDHGLLWAVTFFDETVVPADEIERVRANIARRQQLDAQWAQRA